MSFPSDTSNSLAAVLAGVPQTGCQLKGGELFLGRPSSQGVGMGGGFFHRHIIWPQLGLDGAFVILRDLKRLPASILASNVLRPVWFGVLIQSSGARS